MDGQIVTNDLKLQSLEGTVELAFDRNVDAYTIRLFSKDGSKNITTNINRDALYGKSIAPSLFWTAVSVFQQIIKKFPLLELVRSNVNHGLDRSFHRHIQ